MKVKDSGFRIRVSRELRDTFVATCREQDKPAAQVLREFMREYVEQARDQGEKLEVADLTDLSK